MERINNYMIKSSNLEYIILIRDTEIYAGFENKVLMTP